MVLTAMHSRKRCFLVQGNKGDGGGFLFCAADGDYEGEWIVLHQMFVPRISRK